MAENPASPSFALYHRHDRAFFLACVAMAWVANFMGRSRGGRPFRP